MVVYRNYSGGQNHYDYELRRRTPMYTEDEQQAAERMRQLDHDLNILSRIVLVVWTVLKLAAGAVAIILMALFWLGLVLMLAGGVIWAIVAYELV